MKLEEKRNLWIISLRNKVCIKYDDVDEVFKMHIHAQHSTNKFLILCTQWLPMKRRI